MGRNLIIFVLLLVWIIKASYANAGTIKVIKRPARLLKEGESAVYDHWVLSWGLRDDPPNRWPLGTRVCKTLVQARAIATAHMAKTAENGAGAVTHYLIEGIPTVRSQSRPSLPSFGRIEADALASAQTDFRNAVINVLGKDTESAFKRKYQEVKDAYRRAREAKETVLQNVGKLADDDFVRVNKLVSRYNNIKSRYAGENDQPRYFAKLPVMTPLQLESTTSQQQVWINSWRSWDELQKERDALEKERERLGRERARLAEEGRLLAIDEGRLSKMDALNRNTGSESLAGPFRLRLGRYSNTKGSFQGAFDDFLKARTAGERYMSENAGKQPNYHIIDRRGREIEYDGIYGKKKVSQNQVMVQKNASGGLDLGIRTERRLAVKQRRGRHADAVAKYKKDLVRYQERIDTYWNGLSSYKNSVGAWEDGQYK